MSSQLSGDRSDKKDVKEVIKQTVKDVVKTSKGEMCV
jgi:hypothetical protein